MECEMKRRWGQMRGKQEETAIVNRLMRGILDNRGRQKLERGEEKNGKIDNKQGLVCKEGK